MFETHNNTNSSTNTTTTVTANTNTDLSACDAGGQLGQVLSSSIVLFKFKCLRLKLWLVEL